MTNLNSDSTEDPRLNREKSDYSEDPGVIAELDDMTFYIKYASIEKSYFPDPAEKQRMLDSLMREKIEAVKRAMREADKKRCAMMC